MSQVNSDSQYQRLDEETPIKSGESPVKVQNKILGVHLKEGLPKILLVSIFFTLFFSIGILVFLDLSIVYLLQDPRYFNVNDQEISQVSGDLVFYTTIVSIFFYFTVGYLQDLIGRKYTIGGGGLISSAALIAMPYMPNIYPSLLIVRIIMVFGQAGPLTSPLVADYAKKQSRGLAYAIAGIGAGLGAVFSVFFLFGRTKDMDYKDSFLIAGLFFAAVSVFQLIFIKDVQPTSPDENCLKRVKDVSKNALELSRTNVMIPICFFGSFISRMGDVIVTVFLALYVQTYYDDVHESKVNAEMMTGIGNTLSLVFVGVLGRMSDLRSYKFSLILVFFMRAVGLLAISVFQLPPYHWAAYVLMIIVCIANTSENVIVGSCLSKILVKESRGSITGVFILFGTLGVLFLSKIGGITFTTLGKFSPFILVGSLDFLFCVVCLFIKFKN